MQRTFLYAAHGNFSKVCCENLWYGNNFGDEVKTSVLEISRMICTM